MEIRIDEQQVELLIQLVADEADRVRSGRTVYGGPEAQVEAMEVLTATKAALENALTVLREGHTNDIGWEMLD